MQASLLESPDEHHLVLLDTRIAQLALDGTSLRLQTWSLDASVEIRIGAPFSLRTGGGAPRMLDPSAPESLAPVLALLRTTVRGLTMTRDGELAVAFGEGAELRVRGREGAWELQGAGALEGLAYRPGAAGEAPWP
jgi:hypothetical protein